MTNTTTNMYHIELIPATVESKSIEELLWAFNDCLTNGVSNGSITYNADIKWGLGVIHDVIYYHELDDKDLCITTSTYHIALCRHPKHGSRLRLLTMSV